MAAEIELVCSGSPNSALNGKLFIECIKFLLYERQQLPAPFHDLKRLSTAEQPVERPKTTAGSRKANQSFSDLVNLFDQLERLFLSSHVTSAVIIFGSTAVSARESYLLKFPESNAFGQLGPDCSSNFARICDSSCRKLIRRLITDHNLRMFKDIAPTSMLIFVRVNQTDTIEWFRPKRAFKLPSKGDHCTITVRAAKQESVDPKEINSAVDCDEQEEYLWFQAPLVIRGYKEKPNAVCGSEQGWY